MGSALQIYGLHDAEHMTTFVVENLVKRQSRVRLECGFQ